MSFVSLCLSMVTMFPLPNFQFFKTLFLSDSHINYLFKLYNVISTSVHLGTITPSSTKRNEKKKKLNTNCSPHFSIKLEFSQF